MLGSKEYKQRVQHFLEHLVPKDEQDILTRVREECKGYKKVGLQTYTSILDYMNMPKEDRIAFLENIEDQAKAYKKEIQDRKEAEFARLKRLSEVNALKDRVMGRILDPLKKKLTIAEFLYGPKSEKACNLRSMYKYQLKRSTDNLCISMNLCVFIPTLDDLMQECHDMKLVIEAANKASSAYSVNINEYWSVGDEINFDAAANQAYEVSYVWLIDNTYYIGYFRCRIRWYGIVFRYAYYSAKESPAGKRANFPIEDDQTVEKEFEFDYDGAAQFAKEHKNEIFSPSPYDRLYKKFIKWFKLATAVKTNKRTI